MPVFEIQFSPSRQVSSIHQELISKILAFDVIKFLPDEIISGNITYEHMASFRVKTANKDEKNICIICEKVFTTEMMFNSER